MSIASFLKKPIIQLDGFKVTVLTVLLVALIYMVWRKYAK